MNASEPTTWEYRVVRSADDQELDALGRDGWELAGTAAGEEPVLLFKRPRPSFREQVTLDQKRRYYAQWGLTSNENDGGAAR